MLMPHSHVNPARWAGKRSAGILSILLVGVALAACDSTGGEEFDISAYTGEPYTGEVEGTATFPEGDVEVLFQANASLEVDSLGEGEAGFTIEQFGLVFFSAEGTYDADGARFADGENEMEIEADGDVIGNVIVSDPSFSVEAEAIGEITPTTANIELFAELAEDSGEFPAGTEVRVIYTLAR